MASSSKTPVPIRESKGKSSSHVRVNSSSSTSSDVETTTTPADAIAALNLLTADLGDLLAPSHQWYSEAHRRHALNQLLQQVDAVQSGGNETVRDVRRALVRRVERALEGLPDVEEVASLKGKAVEIREPEPEVVAPAPASTVAPEVEGYDIPDFLEAAPASAPNTESEPELAPATSTTAPEEEPLASKPIASPELDAFSASVSQEWSAEDPANPSASNTLLSLTDDAEVEPVAPTAPDITSAPVEPTPANNEGSADPELVPVARTHAPSTPVKKVARGSASDGEDNFELL
ncbi:hypothetical protein BKA62DRAFT_698754 [Auriculariales sp. MPI-PUGE-AT-0066]|nr:hypothetical protein BKA62DRAFT_698754 [Auriculariales sp. MPI-PUGE-AT-0066]